MPQKNLEGSVADNESDEEDVEVMVGKVGKFENKYLESDGSGQ